MKNRVKILIAGVMLFSIGSVYAENQQDKIHPLYDAIVDQSPVTRSFLTASERNELFKRVSQHPVAGLSHIDKYDHQPTGIGDGEVGFCYGRAMAVHLVARKMGLGNDNIRKLFIAGDLSNGAGIRWRFHMSTLVKGQDGEWWVVDPILPSLGKPGVVTPYEWMQTIKNVFDLRDGVDQSHFFTTDTQSVMVDMRVVPALTELEVQDRLIEPSFEPEGREGFEKVQLHSKNPSPFPVYQVTGRVQEKYFIMRNEAPSNGKKLNDFDFFSFAIVILYKFPEEQNVTYIPRGYNYNGYFWDLVSQLQQPLVPLPLGLERNENPLGSEIFSGNESITVGNGPHLKLYGFQQPALRP